MAKPPKKAKKAGSLVVQERLSKEQLAKTPLIGGPDALLSQAVTAGASIDTLERLMKLRKEMMDEEAKRQFNTAMSAFQEECPMIEKKKSVDNKYKYAPIDSIISQVKSYVKAHGFRYSTTMELKESGVRVSVRVVHALGHEEISVMEVPTGSGTQLMSKPQIVAAATTFAKRYAFLNAFGIMTGDEDTDTSHERNLPQEKVTITPVPTASVQKVVATGGTGGNVPAHAPTGPTYNVAGDDGVLPTDKQLPMLMRRWNEYMKKCGIADAADSDKKLHEFIPWAFRNYKTAMKSVPKGRAELTKKQISYLIDLIPTLPIPTAEKPKEKPVDKDLEFLKPAEKPKPEPKKVIEAEVVKEPSGPSESDILDYITAIGEADTVTNLDALWKDVLELKKKNQLHGKFAKLHLALTKRRMELGAKPSQSAI